ncbi:MAG: complement resistance protein TraT [Desulfovibrio sp.]|nr:complement resistance protein TraT [Desulfovibrio sp.]
MRAWIKSLVLPAFFVFLAMGGCARSGEEGPDGSVEKYHSGSLFMSIKRDVPRVIYIDARDPSGPLSVTPEEIIDAIRSENFEITDSPSKAGYILHINIIKDGKVDPRVFQDLVRAGYGGEANFSGSGARALLADMILVQRNVPTAKRPSRERLQNISARNALDSGQTRVGLLLEGDDAPANDRLFYSALAEELRNVLTPHSED